MSGSEVEWDSMGVGWLVGVGSLSKEEVGGEERWDEGSRVRG